MSKMFTNLNDQHLLKHILHLLPCLGVQGHFCGLAQSTSEPFNCYGVYGQQFTSLYVTVYNSAYVHVDLSALLKMGCYYSTTMCHYWDVSVVYCSVNQRFLNTDTLLCYYNYLFLTVWPAMPMFVLLLNRSLVPRPLLTQLKVWGRDYLNHYITHRNLTQPIVCVCVCVCAYNYACMQMSVAYVRDHANIDITHRKLSDSIMCVVLIQQAYKDAINKEGSSQRLPDLSYTSDQLFFISWSQVLTQQHIRSSIQNK